MIDHVTFKQIESISGASFKVIKIAVLELERKGLKIDDYKIILFDSGNSFIVVFEDPERPKSERGSVIGVPGFEVEVSKNKFNIVRSNFVR